jgi:hypothetical protein
MRADFRLWLLPALMLAAPAAQADCAADIDKAWPIALALPDGNGRNAVLQNIERAKDSRHEGDEEGCQEQIHHVLTLLCPKPAQADQKSKPRQGCGK